MTIRVLVVDDESYLADAICTALNSANMQATAVYDGATARSSIDDIRPDVVVLDRDLPGIHGDDICRWVVDTHPATRVIMLTASGALDDRLAGFDLGADDYLPKPLLALLTAVAGVIGWFVAGLVIKPLRDFADDAATVTRGDLTARIGHQGPDDEVGELADTLNAMLDELEGALERQRRFASNASHELKTPIATIQTMAEVVLTSGDEQVLRDTLVRMREVNARAA